MDWASYLAQLTGGQDTDAYRVARAVIQLESGGNPDAVNENGYSKLSGKWLGIDWGLFQLNDTVGQGKGLNREQLLDPKSNLDRGVGPILASVKRGQAQGLSGYGLFQFVLQDQGAGHTALASRAPAQQQAAWAVAGGKTTPQQYAPGLQLPPSQVRDRLQKLVPGFGVVGGGPIQAPQPTTFFKPGLGFSTGPLIPGGFAVGLPEAAEQAREDAAAAGPAGNTKPLWQWSGADWAAWFARIGLTVAGVVGGLLLLVAGVYLLGQTIKGGE